MMQHQDGDIDGLSGCWGISIWCALESPCYDGLYTFSQDTDGAMFRILCNLLPRNEKGIFSNQPFNLHIHPLKFGEWGILHGKLVTRRNASHQVTVHCSCFLDADAWCHRGIALAGLDMQHVNHRPFSHSHAQEPGGHLLLLPKQWLVNGRPGEWS